MPDRFDFIEIDEGRRSQVRRLGASETAKAVAPSSELPGINIAPEPPDLWRVVETIGGLGAGVGEFRGPRAFTVDRVGHLYVADAGNDRVQRIASDGGVAVLDHARGMPRVPMGVAVDDDLTFYVYGVYDPGLIHAFSSEGALLWRWRVPGIRKDDSQPPSALAVDGRVLVLLHPRQGRILRIRMPEAGRPPSVTEEIRHDLLPEPGRLAVDHRGRIVAADGLQVVGLRRGAAGDWAPAWQCDLQKTGVDAPESVTGLACDRDGRILASLSCPAWRLLLPDEGRQRILELQGVPDENDLRGVAFGPDGSLCIGSNYGRIYRLRPVT